MGYVFFASYSSANRTPALEKFVKQLTDEVFQRVTPPLASPDAVTFFAPSTIELADEWRDRLLDALATSQVIVAICSPHFFASKYCGKELQLFVDRRVAWLKMAGNEQRRARVIFPLIWLKSPPEALPAALQNFQDDHLALPRKYKDKGLKALAELRKESDTFREVLYAVADSIAAAIKETSLPPLPTPYAALDDVTNLFEQAAAPAGERLEYVCLPGAAAGWRPFDGTGAPAPAVADTVAQVAGATASLWTEIAPADDVQARIAAARQAGSPVLVLTDYDTLVAPASAPLWSALAANPPENVAVLVLWRKPPADSNARLAAEAEIGRVMGAFRDGRASHQWFGIETPDALARALTSVAEALRLRLMQAAPGRKVEDAALEQQARANGVPVTAKPIVIGPGGVS